MDRPEPDGIAPGTRIVLIRHAESVGNAGRLMTGHLTCTGLTELGVRQAEALAARLERTQELAGAAALYSSILTRAVATADIISPALGDPPREQSCDLCEMHPGEADGLSWDEYQSRYGIFSVRKEPSRRLAPGGESWLDLIGRTTGVIRRLALAHPGQLVVVVTHGGVIDASMVSTLQLPEHGVVVSWRTYNTSITGWHHGGSRWALVRYNDAAHLTDPLFAGDRYVLEAQQA